MCVGSSVDVSKGKFLGCGTALKLWPRSPTSKIHESIRNRSSKPPGGPERKSYRATGYGGDAMGGQLVLVSTCLTANPLITKGQAHTHTHTVCHHSSAHKSLPFHLGGHLLISILCLCISPCLNYFHAQFSIHFNSELVKITMLPWITLLSIFVMANHF
jgi:hypothetical protein